MYNYSYKKNKATLNKCIKGYNTISIFYLALGIMYSIGGIFLTFLALFTPENKDEFTYFFNGFIFKSIFSAFGYLGCYTKNSLYALIAPVIMALNFVVFINPFNIMLCFISIIFACITYLINNVHAKLEQCDGYPEFNERFSRQEEEKNEKRDKYQEQFEFYKNQNKDTQGKMEEL